jgi:superfamily II DNA or RNA helicase
MEQAHTPVNPAQSKTILTLSNRLILQGAPGDLVDEIRKRLTFDNPAYLENERMGRWNGDTPATIRLYERSESSLIVPRGFTGQTIALIRQHDVRFQFEDRRRMLPAVDLMFTGSLRPFQEEATGTMLKKDFGTLSAPTGCGKTIMAIYCIAERKQPALIVVHTKELLNQWIARIETFLDIPKQEIGVIGAGKMRVGKKITVGMAQTLVKIADEVSPHIGHLIVDECHHCPSRTFTEVVRAFDCRYMLGLSATPWRRDGLSRLIFWFVGDVVHEIKRPGLIETGNVLSFEVVTKETRFESAYDPSAEYTRMLSELTENVERNCLIADTVKTNSQGRGISLVLTDRKAHCEALQKLLKRRGLQAEVLTGDRTSRERKAIVDRLNRGEIRTVIATGQLIGEGFDCPGLTTLYIATPIRFDGRLLQYVGRVLRPAPGKDKAVVVDFIDGRIGVLKAAARARERVYQGQTERSL